ncbi:mycofactocin-coupled SDR family oxidoreductase [Actinomycetospora flava]|uniref:Mycofactocin-coupled SDR family oxidoreductase n=1 Tax=Actinomycetospora flava TaxID=3129232 RepID=A0ABU8M8G2_9PSEU
MSPTPAGDRFAGKVALITGAARGQGRSHALRLAAEGADIIAVDACTPIESVSYAMATPEDLASTAREIEDLGRRVVARQTDVRDFGGLRKAVDEGVAELGGLDVAIANAGVWASAPFTEMPDSMYHDGIDIMMHGVYYTCRAAVPHIIDGGRGGSVVITSSVAGMRGFPRQVQYNMAKQAVVGLMRTLANELAPHAIRVNTLHPTTVNTPMVNNPVVRGAFAPGQENPTADDVRDAFAALNLLDVPWIEPEDMASTVAWLTSDEGRYVTGTCLPVDAGFMEKF